MLKSKYNYTNKSLRSVKTQDIMILQLDGWPKLHKLSLLRILQQKRYHLWEYCNKSFWHDFITIHSQDSHFHRWGYLKQPKKSKIKTITSRFIFHITVGSIHCTLDQVIFLYIPSSFRTTPVTSVSLWKENWSFTCRNNNKLQYLIIYVQYLPRRSTSIFSVGSLVQENFETCLHSERELHTGIQTQHLEGLPAKPDTVIFRIPHR